MKANDIEIRLVKFAARIMNMAEVLPNNTAAKHLGAQIIRSGTAPALNYAEVRGAESKADFIHKMKICLKELRETMVCLELIESRGWFKEGKLSALLRENDELIAIFVSSAKTARTKSAIKKS